MKFAADPLRLLTDRANKTLKLHFSSETTPESVGTQAAGTSSYHTSAMIGNERLLIGRNKGIFELM